MEMNDDLSHIRTQITDVTSSIHGIQMTLVSLTATVEERGRLLSGTEAKINEHEAKIIELTSQVSTLNATKNQASSIFKDYIFPILIPFCSFFIVSIIALNTFKSNIETYHSSPPSASQQK